MARGATASRGDVSPIRLARAVWRYRGQLEGHGAAYQVELATAIRTTIVSTVPGRFALSGYRFAMRMLLAAIAVLVVIAILFAVGLWQLSPWASLAALVPLAGAVVVTLWRLSWGAPLDWLSEHADPSRQVTVAELPGRLRELAAETRTIANVPARLADELEALARETEHVPG